MLFQTFGEAFNLLTLLTLLTLLNKTAPLAAGGKKENGPGEKIIFMVHGGTNKSGVKN
jgi:hypothetical protein